MKRIDDFTHLSSSDNQYVDSLYETYRNNPEELDESWVSFFRGFEFQMGGAVSGADISNEQMRKEFNVFRLISPIEQGDIFFRIQTQFALEEIVMPISPWRIMI